MTAADEAPAAEVTEATEGEPSAPVPTGRDLVGYDRAVRACLGGMLLGRFRILDTADFLYADDLRYVGGSHARVLEVLRTTEVDAADPGWASGLPTGMTSGRTGRVGWIEFVRRTRGIPVAGGRALGVRGAAEDYLRYLRFARRYGLAPTRWPQLDADDRRRFGEAVLSVLDGRLRDLAAVAAGRIDSGLTAGSAPDAAVDAAVGPVHAVLTRRRVAAGRFGLMPPDGWGVAAQLPGANTPRWTPFTHAAALAARMRALAADSGLDRDVRAAALTSLLREYVRIGYAAAAPTAPASRPPGGH